MHKVYFNKDFPHLLHGADYNPEQWIADKTVWDRDMETGEKPEAVTLPPYSICILKRTGK